MKVDYDNVVVSGELAFTVGVERQQDVRVGNQPESPRRALRVTQIFWKEESGWKLVHRHADQVMEQQQPGRLPARE